MRDFRHGREFGTVISFETRGTKKAIPARCTVLFLFLYDESNGGPSNGD